MEGIDEEEEMMTLMRMMDEAEAEADEQQQDGEEEEGEVEEVEEEEVSEEEEEEDDDYDVSEEEEDDDGQAAARGTVRLWTEEAREKVARELRARGIDPKTGRAYEPSELGREQGQEQERGKQKQEQKLEGVQEQQQEVSAGKKREKARRILISNIQKIKEDIVEQKRINDSVSEEMLVLIRRSPENVGHAVQVARHGQKLIDDAQARLSEMTDELAALDAG